MSTFTLEPEGPFSLAAAARFGQAFAPSPTAGSEATIRLAFAAERAGWQTVGVELSQRGRDVHGRVVTRGGRAPARGLVDAAREQARRILSLDVDGRGFPALAERDPVVAALQARYPGLRPVLFLSPYEAAAWAIISQRIRITQAARIKAELARAHGESVAFRDGTLAAFPAPPRLAALEPGQRGLSDRKTAQLRALGHAALAGSLDADRLRRQAREDALRELQRLPGVGPFAAELVLIRGAGEPDYFPAHERRLEQAIRSAYGLPAGADADRLRTVADGWAPYRSWVAVLLRRWLEDGAPPLTLAAGGSAQTLHQVASA